jgi:hypothetical protein
MNLTPMRNGTRDDQDDQEHCRRNGRNGRPQADEPFGHSLHDS